MANAEINQITVEKIALTGTENMEGQDGIGGVGSSFRATIANLFTFFNTAIGTIGTGRKVGRTSPTFGFRDIIGQIYPDTGGSDAPSLSVWRGSNRRFAYGAGDRMGTEIHMPHDLVQADMHGHFHWGHNGTSITGDLVVQVYIDHTKGHRQAGGTNINFTHTVPSASLAQYSSDITDVLFATSGGTGGILDSDTIEPDDSVHVEVIVTSIPTITGGVSSSPFIWNADIHAQTTGELGTKNKSPNFYV